MTKSNQNTKIRALIIEDEPYAQQELIRLLSNVPQNISIIECIDSIEESVLWFQKNPHPDIVFMDIQLSDGLSFEIFKSVRIKSPVIFTTAFDEYAIRAFKVNSIDYLLKPIDQQALIESITKFEELKNQYSGPELDLNQNQIDQLMTFLKPSSEYKSRFITKIGDQIKYIKTDDIAYFFAEDNVVFLVIANEGKYIIDHSLNELTVYLDPRIFFRINRTYFVNIKSIVKVHKFFNSRLKVELKPSVNEDILISRVKVQDFLNWMES